MPKPTVFIGSSREGLPVAKAIQANLAREAACTIWTQGLFRPGSFTLEVLEREAQKRDFAVLVLTPDVLQISRDEKSFIPRPNVLFELGLFMGRLGRNRVFAVHPRDKPLDRPSDLLGLTLLDYEPDGNVNLQSALGSACTEIGEVINDVGITVATPSLVDRSMVYSVVGTLDSRLQSAQEEIRISGFDCKYVIRDHSEAIEAALSRGVKFKVMMVDPNTEAVSLLDKIEQHYLSDNDLRGSICKSLPLLSQWRKAHEKLFEYRYLPVLPVVGMFISDPYKEGIMKVELYTHEHRHGDVSRPHLVISPAIISWRRYFLKQWDLYWERSRIPDDVPEQEYLGADVSIGSLRSQGLSTRETLGAARLLPK